VRYDRNSYKMKQNWQLWVQYMNMFYCPFFSLEIFQPALNNPSLTLLLKTDIIRAPGSSALFEES